MISYHQLKELSRADFLSSVGLYLTSDRLRMVRELQSGGFLNPGAKLAKAKQGTGKRLTAEEKRKLRKQREKDLRKRKRDDRRDRNGSG